MKLWMLTFIMGVFAGFITALLVVAIGRMRDDKAAMDAEVERTVQDELERLRRESYI